VRKSGAAGGTWNWGCEFEDVGQKERSSAGQTGQEDRKRAGENQPGYPDAWARGGENVGKKKIDRRLGETGTDKGSTGGAAPAAGGVWVGDI